MSFPTQAAEIITSRRVEEAKRQAVDAAPSTVLEEKADFTFASGAWINSRFSTYRNTDNDKTLEDALSRACQEDIRVWFRTGYQTPAMKQDGRQHAIYVRLRDTYLAEGGRAPEERFDNRGPLLDYGYVSWDEKPWKIEVGRRFFNLGRGFIYSGVHDGLQVNYQIPGWNLGALVSRLPPHTANTDTSIPGYDKESRRSFYGLGIGYAGIKNHQIYGYTLVERDQSQEKPEDDLQDYQYQAEYFALGAKGQWTQRWPYWVEIAHQSGRSQEYPSNAASDISAWALDVEQHYRTKTRSRLLLTAQYAFASGDADRESVTDTLFGNESGRDTAFRYFGYLPTGIAWGPQLSNLHMLHFGAELFPFYKIRKLRNVLLGLDYYRYWKNRAAGAIDDIDATETAHDVGQEFDAQLDWRISSRLICSFEWGHFSPGRAYSETARAAEELFSVSISMTF